MDEIQAVRYLESLIGQTLRVHATDSRIFVGVFKCTDAVSLTLNLLTTVRLLYIEGGSKTSKLTSSLTDSFSRRDRIGISFSPTLTSIAIQQRLLFGMQPQP